MQHIAQQWARANNSPPALDSAVYCATRDVFSVRLETLLTQLEGRIGQDAYLLTAVTGEIGNNSFDHNLGNWPDVPGVFFAHQPKNNTIVVADRGQGVLKTISRVKPDITTDHDALMAAFTQMISGRAPERRGNGLKFVIRAIREQRWSLTFQSGNAILSLSPGKELSTAESTVTMQGTLAILSY